MPTFSLFIHNANSSTPTLLMEIGSDWERVRALANRALAESELRLAVEVRHDDRLGHCQGNEVERLFGGYRWLTSVEKPRKNS